MTGMVYFSTRNSNTIPRVVAATVKAKNMKNESISTKNLMISGDLRVVQKSISYLRYGEVCNGCLVLYEYVKSRKEFDYQIPLHDLNISLDSPKYLRQFSLTKYDEITPVATFQVIEIDDYDKWLRALAFEIIRQTPLNTLKFLDVLFVNESLKRAGMKKFRTRDAFAMTLPQRRSHDKSSTEMLDYSRSRTASGGEASDFSHYRSANSIGNLRHRLSSLPSQTALEIYDFDATLTDKFSSESVDSGFCSLQSSSDGKYDQDCSPEPNRKYHRSQNVADGDSKPANFIREILQIFESTSAVTPAPVETTKTKRRSTAIFSSSCNKLMNKIKKRGSLRTKTSVDDNPTGCIQECPTCSGTVIWNPVVTDVRLHDEDTRTANKICDSCWSKIKQAKNSSPIRAALLPEVLLENEDANALIRLLTRCQIDKQYVPVKEKRLLFESLSRFSFSVGNLEKREIVREEENAKSYSLRYLFDIPVPVKVMKNYFENFDESRVT